MATNSTSNPAPIVLPEFPDTAGVSSLVAGRLMAQARTERTQALAAHLGFTVAPNADWQCAERLRKHTHRCTSNKCYEPAVTGGSRIPDEVPFRHTLDHVVWLRDPTDGRWALLVQPYQFDEDFLNGWCEADGLTWEDLHMEAPHGHGTSTLIIRGR